MKNLITTFLLCTAFHISPMAQTPGRPFPPGSVPPPNSQPVEELPKFDLQFPGGTAGVFVLHLQDALKQVDENLFINIIVPPEFERTQLPPLKMRDIDVVQLFRALEMASQKSVVYDTGQYTFDGSNRRSIQQTGSIRFGFTTTGPITRNSIWYFFAEEPPRLTPAKMVRYFQLGPYLSEFTMDDIGSAIEAGWNMLGQTNTPKLNFHQDTKLLIAAGSAHHLEMISAMLKELGAGLTNITARAVIAKPASEPVVAH